MNIIIPLISFFSINFPSYPLFFMSGKMKYFTAIADKNLNLQNENEINEYIILYMQEIVAHILWKMYIENILRQKKHVIIKQRIEKKLHHFYNSYHQNYRQNISPTENMCLNYVLCYLLKDFDKYYVNHILWIIFLFYNKIMK